MQVNGVYQANLTMSPRRTQIKNLASLANEMKGEGRNSGEFARRSNEFVRRSLEYVANRRCADPGRVSHDTARSGIRKNGGSKVQMNVSAEEILAGASTENLKCSSFDGRLKLRRAGESRMPILSGSSRSLESDNFGIEAEIDQNRRGIRRSLDSQRRGLNGRKSSDSQRPNDAHNSTSHLSCDTEQRITESGGKYSLEPTRKIEQAGGSGGFQDTMRRGLDSIVSASRLSKDGPARATRRSLDIVRGVGDKLLRSSNQSNGRKNGEPVRQNSLVNVVAQVRESLCVLVCERAGGSKGCACACV